MWITIKTFRGDRTLNRYREEDSKDTWKVFEEGDLEGSFD